MFTKWWMEDLSTKGRKLSRTLGLLAICASLVAASGCALLPNEDEEEDIPVITPPTISKKPEYEVRKGPIVIDVSAVGKIMSQREEPLFFTKGDLHIKNVLVKAGDKVKQGDPLIELDVEELQKDLRKKKLEFRKQEIPADGQRRPQVFSGRRWRNSGIERDQHGGPSRTACHAQREVRLGENDAAQHVGRA